MKQEYVSEEKKELIKICCEVRELVENRAYEKCDLLLKSMIGKYPHAPEPHNLFGLLLELRDNHLLAMKHFRAAWALDPTYLPSRHNLQLYGTLFFKGNGAFDETDCPKLVEQNIYKTQYDENGIGHIVRRNKE